MVRRNKLTLVLTFGVLLLLLAEPSFASNVLDTAVDKYRIAADNFGSKILQYGYALLFPLALIQLGVNFSLKLVGELDTTQVVAAFLRFVLTTCFFAAMIKLSSTYLPMIIDSFEFIGQTGSGLTKLTPSTIITQGIQLQDLMVQQFNQSTGADSGLFAAVTNFVPALWMTAICIIIFLSFVVLAGQMALTLIQSYFWLCLTPLFLGFGGLSFTRDFAISTLKGGITIGMKILCVYLVAATAGTLAPMMGEGMKDVTLTNWSPMFWALAVSMILAYLSFQLPKLAGDLLNGTASLSAGDAATNMAMGAAALVGTVAGVGAAAGATMGAMGSAAGAAGKAVSGLSQYLSGASQAGSISNAAGAAGGGSAASSAPAAAPGASPAAPSTQSAAPPVSEPDYAAAERIAAEHSRGSMGDASTASIGGAESPGASPQQNKSPLHERIRSAGNNMPNDSATVGMNANISTQIGD